MRTTGIVRKIDELGRIVLPKELRTVMNINAGDDFQILLDDNKVILEKYQKIKNSEEEIVKILNCFSTNYECKFYLIVGNKLVNKNNEIVSSSILSLINERKLYINEIANQNKITDNTAINGKVVLFPIVVNSDLLGAVLVVGKEDIKELVKISKIINSLIKNFF